MDEASQRLLRQASRTCSDIDFAIIGLDEKIFPGAVEPALCAKWLMVVLGGTLSRAFEVQPELKKQIPDARAAVDLRDRLLDELKAIDDRLVWQIATTSVPNISEQIESLLGTSLT